MTSPFEIAAAQMRRLKGSPKQDEGEELYGLYKQVTVGDVNIECPGILEVMKYNKWKAWNSKKGQTKEEAMTKYIVLASQLKETYGTKNDDHPKH